MISSPPVPTARRLLVLTTGLALLIGMLPGLPAAVRAATTVFINEIHYDNTGTDTGEFVEVAFPTGTDLTGWTLVLYNGNGGAPYGTPADLGALSQVGATQGYAFVVVNYPTNGIQNGSPDGIALVDDLGGVVQFLSYEGFFSGVGGPADGLTSTDIGVPQTGSEVVGSSLQLTGTGLADEDFTWASTAAHTAGAINTGQTFGTPPPPPASTAWINEFHYDNAGTDTGEFIEIAVADGTDLSGWSIVRYNGANQQSYNLPDEPDEADLGLLPVTGATSGFGFVVVAYPPNGLQNGAPDGFALVDDGGAVVQFLSYEGAFTAANGPASGVTSSDVGASQTGSEVIGSSLQLTGTGLAYADFTWVSTSAHTAGAVNTGQVIGSPEPVAPCDTPEADLTPIHDIQGAGATTPMFGTEVVTRGVVTADFTSGGDTGIPQNQGLRGFFIEAVAADRDGDPQTSEGIFVFDASAVFDGDIGDAVAVAGFAGEFGGVTQVSLADVEVCIEADATLPDPATLPLPTAPADRAAVFEPLESMRVVHPELTVIEFFQLERFGEIRLSASGVQQTPTNVHLPGSADWAALVDANAAAAIILDDGRTGQNLNRLGGADLLPYVHEGGTLRIGDQLLDHPAVLHFAFEAWRLQPIDIDAVTDALASNRTRPRPEDPPEVGGTLKVASFNVLNYFDGDGQGGGFPTTRGATTASEFARQTEKLVDAILRLDADVYGLIEIENDGGQFQATRTLVEALNAAAGGEVYRFVDTGVIGTDEIKQAFVYNRWTVRPVADFAILDSSVDPRFDDTRSRPALAQTFLRLGSGERVTVVVNHFKSKGVSGLTDMSDPDFDQLDGQGFWNHTRTQSALALADWLATNPTNVQSLGALVIGDLNAYGREDPIRALEDAGYEDQLVRFTSGPPYTFTFDGQQGTLDTALAMDDLAGRVTGAAVWHINADEVPAIDYQESVGFPENRRFRTPEIAAAYYDPSAFRSSDHDPVVIGLDLSRRDHPGRR